MFSKFVIKSNILNRGRSLLLLRKSEIIPAGFKSHKYSTSISTDKKSYAEHLECLSEQGIKFGQPTHYTHPHLLKRNELVPGILPVEFENRRRKLMEKIHERCNSFSQAQRNIVIIPGAVKKYMTGKIPYFFRQSSDFYYLTGCLEPESTLVLWSDNAKETISILFMRPNNKHDELWDGSRTGVNHSIELFGVDEAYSINDFSKICQKLVTGQTNNVWYDMQDENFNSILSEKLKTIEAPNSTQYHSIVEFLNEIRVIKSPAEINLMRRTCEIASEAINQTMKETQPGDSEHHIHARADFYCRMKNASFLAYPPVVAAGDNANTIHYITNTQIAKDNELVLMDAGCEYGGYSSDITRTWPVNGKFTPAQETLYDVVYTVQMELLETAANARDISLDQLFHVMCIRLGKYLQEIGVIDKSLSVMDAAKEAMINFCPHHVSHYLGMDIHDTPLISRERQLEAGMIFTIEPGVYISSKAENVPAEFRGIGIRIEDDVLCTENGIENLTKKCVKDKTQLKELILK